MTERTHNSENLVLRHRGRWGALSLLLLSCAEAPAPEPNNPGNRRPVADEQPDDATQEPVAIKNPISEARLPAWVQETRGPKRRLLREIQQAILQEKGELAHLRPTSPSVPEIHSRLARAQLELLWGTFDEKDQPAEKEKIERAALGQAIKHLEEAVKGKADRSLLVYELGLTHEIAGDLEEAREAYREVAEATPPAEEKLLATFGLAFLEEQRTSAGARAKKNAVSGYLKILVAADTSGPPNEKRPIILVTIERVRALEPDAWQRYILERQETARQGEQQDTQKRLWAETEAALTNIAQKRYLIGQAKQIRSTPALAVATKRQEAEAAQLEETSYCPKRFEFIQAFGKSEFDKLAQNLCTSTPPVSRPPGSDNEVKLTKECKAVLALPCIPPSKKPGGCSPLAYGPSMQAYPGQSPPYAFSSKSKDLDGDGVPEIEVSYATSVTSSGMTVLKKTPDAWECFRVVYEGTAGGMTLRSTKTNGWFDVELSFMLLQDTGRGSGVVLMTFDGTQYKFTKALSCSGTPDPSACEALIMGQAP